MNYKIILFPFFFAIQGNQTFAQSKDSVFQNIQYFKTKDTSKIGFKKPKFIDMFRYIPKDIIGFGKFTIQKENIKWDALAFGSTLILIPYDQKILNDCNALGNRLGGWDKDSKYDKIAGVLRIVPKNIPSAIYYIGNGGTTLLLSGVFYTIGKFGEDDFRALNTSNELVEVLLSVGITTQTIKRITGRQSPSATTKDGGEWNPFPSFEAFQNNTPNYDAMPSGHLATYIATLTVISTNYPELKWIKPVGYTVGGILAYNMVSGKVHWPSDYPIAIFMGYVIGKNIANRRIIKPETTIKKEDKKTSFKTQYNFNRIDNKNALQIVITF